MNISRNIGILCQLALLVLVCASPAESQNGIAGKIDSDNADGRLMTDMKTAKAGDANTEEGQRHLRFITTGKDAGKASILVAMNKDDDSAKNSETEPNKDGADKHSTKPEAADGSSMWSWVLGGIGATAIGVTGFFLYDAYDDDDDDDDEHLLAGSANITNEGLDPGARGNPSFSLTWSWSDSSHSEGPDIDIWVTCPNGHTISTSRNDYSLGPDPEGGEIDFDDLGGNGPGDGGGPERAYWPTGQGPTGTYTYGVRYYGGDGTANYTVRAYVNGAINATKTGSFSAPGSAIQLGTVTVQ